MNGNDRTSGKREYSFLKFGCAGNEKRGCKVKVYWSCPTPWFLWLKQNVGVCEDMLTILLHSHCQLIMKENVRPHSDTLRNIYSPIIYYLAGKTMHSNVLKVS